MCGAKHQSNGKKIICIGAAIVNPKLVWNWSENRCGCKTKISNTDDVLLQFRVCQMVETDQSNGNWDMVYDF